MRGGVWDAPLAATVSFPTVLLDACVLLLLQKTPERSPYALEMVSRALGRRKAFLARLACSDTTKFSVVPVPALGVSSTNTIPMSSTSVLSLCLRGSKKPLSCTKTRNSRTGYVHFRVYNFPEIRARGRLAMRSLTSPDFKAFPSAITDTSIVIFPLSTDTSFPQCDPGMDEKGFTMRAVT